MISDEEKGQVIIGEAAVNLIFRSQDISLESLLDELKMMAEYERDDERVLCISEVRRWLKAFRQAEGLPCAVTDWFAPPPGHHQATAPGAFAEPGMRQDLRHSGYHRFLQRKSPR